MSGFIKVSASNCNFEKLVPFEEGKAIMKLAEKSRKVIGLALACLVPVRTNNLTNFSKDFFLPTTVNYALKVQNVSLKILACIASVILDVITFPFRLFTAIPRVIANASQEEHPLHKFLVKEGVCPKLLESGHVHMQFLEISGRGYMHKGIPVIDYEQQEPSGDVNFIETPPYGGSGGLYAGSRSSGEKIRAEALPKMLDRLGIKDPAVTAYFAPK